MEQNLQVQLTQELNQPNLDEEKQEKNIESAARYFSGSIKYHKRYALNFLLVYGMNFLLMLLHLSFLYFTTGTDFKYFAYKVLNYIIVPPEQRSSTFPLVTNCDFRFYNTVGNIITAGSICTLKMNDVSNFASPIYIVALTKQLLTNFMGKIPEIDLRCKSSHMKS